MNKKMSRRERDIKSKLMAAIAMLLVSSIMMVSTTYAWFTLSTAPEVTGISTSVGANGNLEMALQPTSGDSSTIKSDVGDSNKNIVEKNITWGNIVDVSDDNAYGLSYITLNPSKLNATDSVIQASPLQTPAYGADGRVSELEAKTVTGLYANGSFTASSQFGVRGVGISSSMSARQLAMRAALSAASTADGQAKRLTSESLNANGADLADIAINHALYNSADPEIYTDADRDVLKKVVAGLLGDEDTNTPGSLGYIEGALRKYMLANALATCDDTEYLTIKNTIENEDTALTALVDTYGTASMKGDTGYVAKLTAAITAATTAQEKLNEMTDGTYEWNEIHAAMSPLLNTDYLRINDMTVEEVMADKGAVASSVMSNGLILTMAPGSGVYADIADFCGDYKAQITIKELSYGEMSVPNVKATMETKTTANPVYLKQASNEVATFTGGNSSENPISDFYGYIIDMAFRTNAADSYLQLQPEAIDRIYTDGENEATMGHGACMTFASSSTEFYKDNVINLMKNIRVVFFTTDDNKIIGYARLDHEHPTDETDGSVTMKLMMTDKDGNAIADDDTTDYDESVKIMPLTQNGIHELSALVYLDGESITNADVAYNAATSMTGSMNLQFSSSAELNPMDYTPLEQANEEGTDTPKPVSVRVDSITEGYYPVAAYYVPNTTEGATGGKVGVQIKSSIDDKEVTGGTVKITVGDEVKEATYETFNSISGWVVDAAAAPAGVSITLENATTSDAANGT